MSDPHLYVGFSQGQGKLAWLVRQFTGEGVNHAFLTWCDEHLGWVVMGANANGVTLDTWENFTKTRTVQALFRPKDGLHPLWAGLIEMRDEINARYDKAGLVGMAVVEIAGYFGKSVANPWSRNGETFCSQFAVNVVRKSGFWLLEPTPANSISPHGMCHALAGDADFLQLSSRPD